MTRASITEAKNRLSALLERVRQGETVIIEDRGVPVARLESMISRDGQGRLARLERQGLIRAPAGPVARKVLASQPPRPKAGAVASEFLIAERREAR